jgi:hypothetical protein
MQSELAEAVETAQEVASYEPEEDETVTAPIIKKALKELIESKTAKLRLKTKPTNWNTNSSSSVWAATSSRPKVRN